MAGKVNDCDGRSEADSDTTASPALSRECGLDTFGSLRVFGLFETVSFVFELEFFTVRGQKERMIGLPIVVGREHIVIPVIVPVGDLRLWSLPIQRGSADLREIPLERVANLVEIRFVGWKGFDYGVGPALPEGCGHVFGDSAWCHLVLKISFWSKLQRGRVRHL